MSLKTHSKLLVISAVCPFVLTPQIASANAQNTSAQSLVQAARRDREREKAAKKPEKVITNDTLEAAGTGPNSSVANGAVSSPGNAPSSVPAGQQSSAQASSSTKAPSEDQNTKKEQAAELAELKKKLANAESDLDLIQRQIALQQETFYSNPDYMHDTAGKAQLDQMNQQAHDKKQAVEALKAQLDALQQKMETSAPTD